MSKPTKKQRLPDPAVTAFLFVQKLTGQPHVEDKPKPATNGKKKPAK